MSVLNLSITERILNASDLSQIFSGAQNIDSIQVTFDSEWTGFTKKAVFTSTKEDCFFVALDSSNSAKIPATVLEESGTILIGILGEKGDQRITSSLLRYRVGRGVSVTDLLDPAAAKSILDLLNEALANAGGTTGTGAAGYTFTPSVSSDGVISWTNNGGLENPTSVSIKGPKGTSVSTITRYYYRTTTSTKPASTSGFTTSYTVPTSTSPYLWGYDHYVFTDGTSQNSSIFLLGVFGKDGISPTLSSSKSGKITTISVTDANGTRELAEISDGESSEGGAKITDISQYFLRSSSGSGITTETSGWSTTMPSLTVSSAVMWTYFKVTLSDGSEINSLPIVAGYYHDRPGTITIRYLRNNSTVTPSTSSSGWTSTYQEPTSASPYLWCHFRFSFYSYGSSGSHYLDSSVFKLKTYEPSSASGVVLDLTDSTNVNDTKQGDAALESIQSGIMPLIYQNNAYMHVLKVSSVNNCGTHYIRLTYMEPTCSGAIFTSVDWMTTN